MKQFFLFFLLTSFLTAQITVVSTVPANNAKNVPLITTVSVIFSEAIDTTAMKNAGEDSQFSNIDSVLSSGFSVDGKTMYANAVLEANHTYFIAFTYVKAKSGAVLSTPFVSRFTTGADFPPYSVSGTLLTGTSGVMPEGSIVGLSSRNIMEGGDNGGPPPFVGWANVNSNGSFTIPYMKNGTYWAIAAKDADHDGSIIPDGGVDAIAFSDSIVIKDASVTNLNLTFIKMVPKMLHEVIADAETLAMKNLPADRVLRRVSGYDVDTLGRSNGWEFTYSINGNMQGKAVRVGTMETKVYDVDYNHFNWIQRMKPITNLQLAATSATVIASVENAGGRTFRKLPVPPGTEMRVEISLNDATNGWFGGNPIGIDTNKIYWNVAYIHNIQVTNDSAYWTDGLFFLCDLTTGAMVATRTMDVADDLLLPSEYVLQQNFPNPFNPATSIRFVLPRAGMTTLKIYDLLGREVAELVNERKEAGEYTIPFNAPMLTSGIYFYQLRSGTFVETKKMLLVR